MNNGSFDLQEYRRVFTNYNRQFFSSPIQINSFPQTSLHAADTHNQTFQMAGYQGRFNDMPAMNSYGMFGDYDYQRNSSYYGDRALASTNNANISGNVPLVTSNLTPDAKEFKPSGSGLQNNNENNAQSTARNGAIRKTYYRSYNENRRNQSRKDSTRRNNYNRYGNRYETNNGENRKYKTNYESGPNKRYNGTKQDKNRENTIDSDVNDTDSNFEDKSENSDFQNHSEYRQINGQNENKQDKNYNRNSYSSYNSKNYRNRENYKPSRDNTYGRNYKTYANNNQNKNYNTKFVNEIKRTQEIASEPTEKKPLGKNKINSSVTYSNNRNSNYNSLTKKLDSVSQRERLEELIMRSLLECLVCYEKLRHRDKIWACKQCYHIIHLQCVKRWAESSKLESGWRCPACQNICPEIPDKYHCYCGKFTEPQFVVGSIPHSCNEICGRKGRLCSHKCTLICHPGPCPDCNIMVTKSCRCGATTAMVKCSSVVSIKCTSVCNKLLNCGLHMCKKICHEGSCGPCLEKIIQECHCYKQCRKVTCTAELNGSKYYSCGDKCEKFLGCGNHKCQELCHEGECKPCSKSPSEVSTCPCGKTKLQSNRKSCLDPIPCCDRICGKILKCGQPGRPHQCKEKCHNGDCPPCPLSTSVKCRCGNMDKDIPCSELTTRADDARCQKKCTKKRSCGKHKCNQFCCIDFEHICPLPCNRILSCGNHRCENTCHKGRCPPCLQSSFEELYCECGSSVIFPPVPCGTKPPACDQPCSRPRPCGHEPLHNCHTGPCPPCTILTKTWCYGKHEQRSTIPCHQEDFSCGLPCGKPMPCRRHKCVHPCHRGACPQPCKQPCMETRATCGHPCNQPCHEPPCPETPCRQTVKVSCQCGLRSTSKICLDLAGEYQNIVMSQLATKMEEMQRGEAVDLSDIATNQKKGGMLKALECNEECRVVERNRRMAIALQVTNAETQQKIVPKYSDYMRQWAKKNPAFCQYVHNKLTELVQLAKQSKQKSRSYSFESMNKEKRHFVHEYCEHFGCESAAYDPEPNRNVVATALRDKSYLPSYSLLEVIQRESGQRKVPGPQQLEKGQSGKPSAPETVSLRVTGRLPRPPTPPAEYIDYFDSPPV